MSDLERRLITWAASSLGTTVVSVRGLRDGGSPWLLEGDGRSAVLRVGTVDGVEALRVELVALELARSSGVAVPHVLASDLDGDPPVLLVTTVAGSSAIPRTRPAARLRALGAAAAALHRIEPPADRGLPRRDRPIGSVDFDVLRRTAPRRDLLVRAEQVRDAMRRDDAPGFVHGDLWQGNVLWVGDRVTGLIDWDCAGIGPAGVDLGSLRCDAAMCFGLAAAADVQAGWEAEAGRPADDVAGWDIVAALSTPPDVGWFAGAISAQGRPDLTRELLERRRDAFLTAALAARGG